MEILIFIGLACVVGIAAWIGHQAAKARRDALAALAGRLGLAFRPEARDWGGGLFSRRPNLAPFPVFDQGHTRRSINHLEGSLRVWDRDLAVLLADYSYRITSGSGKNQTTHTYHLSFLLLRLPFGDRLPALRLRREHFGDRLAAAVGFEDIDFESAEFSRRFHVSSSDRRFTYQVIDPRMIEFLLDTEPPRVALAEGWLLVTPPSGLGRWEPGQFSEAADWTRDFLARWPEFVVKDWIQR